MDTIAILFRLGTLEQENQQRVTVPLDCADLPIGLTLVSAQNAVSPCIDPAESAQVRLLTASANRLLAVFASPAPDVDAECCKT